MMESIKFNSIDELHKRLLPALRSKCKLLSLNGCEYISEKDIWDFMSLNVWNNTKGLELCDMVDDILNASDTVLVSYYREKVLNSK